MLFFTSAECHKRVHLMNIRKLQSKRDNTCWLEFHIMLTLSIDFNCFYNVLFNFQVGKQVCFILLQSDLCLPS